MDISILNKFSYTDTKLGKAVLSQEEYVPGSVILKFEGEIITKDRLPHASNMSGSNDRYVQVGPNEHMGPSNGVDDYINHSCDPNAGLHFTSSGIYLVAIKPITIGEEITWDYSTTMLKHDWTMNCACGSPLCRKVIRSFEFLPADIQEKYVKLNVVPSYILDVYNGILKK